MARNIEIKARIDSLEAITAKVAAPADHGPIEISQDDTFFVCERGRMKLRAFSATDGQLIFYQRANQAGPQESFFVIAPTAAPDSLREALSLAYGQAGRVRKHRTVYRVGRTCVHLDSVEHLGHFLELEVALSEGESPAAGVEEAHTLLAALGIPDAQLIAGAYVDLLAQQHAERQVCRRRRIVYARSSLPLFAAPETWRSASAQDARQGQGVFSRFLLYQLYAYCQWAAK